MQIFGQNIFGIFSTEEGVYTGELDLLLHRLINAQLYVTSDNRLSGSSLAILMNANTSQTAALTLSRSGHPFGIMSTSSPDDSKREASIFIEQG